MMVCVQALKPVDHPEFGKILVARYDLPRGYRTVYWGHRRRDELGGQKGAQDRALRYARGGGGVRGVGGSLFGTHMQPAPRKGEPTAGASPARTRR
eukprot:COSAG01_NODE_9941_length_2295_cov_69.980874_3_plen_96_part_00